MDKPIFWRTREQVVALSGNEWTNVLDRIFREARFMKRIEKEVTSLRKPLAAIGLAAVLMGCALPRSDSTCNTAVSDRGAQASARSDSGLRDYREILADPGPF